MRQPAFRRSDRAEEIRDAALTLFDERGYHGTRMADIASQLGMRAPSLYNHVAAKQDLLREVMIGQMKTLLAEHAVAIASTADVAEQLRRAMEGHVRYHARFRREGRISAREIANLEEPARTAVLDMRTEYALAWQTLIERGVAEGRFTVTEPKLSAYALLQLGVGVSMWGRPPASSESDLAYAFGEMALRVVAEHGTLERLAATLAAESSDLLHGAT